MGIIKIKRQYKITIAFIITLLVFAKFQQIAYIDRQYFAYGGEWLIWILPIIYSTKKDKKVLRKSQKRC